MSEEYIVKGLASYRSQGTRSNYTRIAGMRVLIDCYNASEEALKSIALTLSSLKIPKGGKRILVVGDIDDKLGELTEEVHRRVGQNFAATKDIDEFLFFGHRAEYIADEMRRLGKEAFSTASRDELEARILEILNPKDIIAFKGGQQMRLAVTVDRIFGTAFTLLDGDELERRGELGTTSLFKLRVIEEYGVQIVGFLRGGRSHEITLPYEFRGVPARVVGRSAFFGDLELKSVVIQAPIETIARAAFMRCENLKKVILPGSLKLIDASAFSHCKSLRELVVPEGVTTINDRAFYNCPNLQRLELPKSLKTIGDEILHLTRDVEVVCHEGSYAAKKIVRKYPSRKMILVHMSPAERLRKTKIVRYLSRGSK